MQDELGRGNEFEREFSDFIGGVKSNNPYETTTSG